MGVGQWSGEAQAALITGVVALLGALLAGFRWLLDRSDARAFQQHERGWQRAAELEEEVKLLRIALHRATLRGNDGWTVSEILALAMPLSLEDRLRAVKQTREIIERSLGGSR